MTLWLIDAGVVRWMTMYEPCGGLTSSVKVLFVPMTMLASCGKVDADLEQLAGFEQLVAVTSDHRRRVGQVVVLDGAVAVADDGPVGVSTPGSG